jgi:hypothetical protein
MERFEIEQLGQNVTKLRFPRGKELLFSYKTLVGVFCPEDRRWFVTATKYSRTTSKHVTQWCVGHPERPNIALEQEDLELKAFPNPSPAKALRA